MMKGPSRFKEMTTIQKIGCILATIYSPPYGSVKNIYANKHMYVYNNFCEYSLVG